jgi:hypothetical protein
MKTAVRYSTYFERVSSLFMSVGRSAPRYEALAAFYPRSGELRHYFLEYYTVVVQMCNTIFAFLQKSVVKRLVMILNDSELSNYEFQLRHLGNSVKDEASLQMATDVDEEKRQNASLRSISAKISGSVAHRQILKRNLKVLNHCSTFDHEIAWKQIRKTGKASFFQIHPITSNEEVSFNPPHS